MLWVRRTWNDFSSGYAVKARPLALLVQCIRSGSQVVIPHASNDRTIVSFVIASHARTTYCTINGLGGALMLPAGVLSRSPSAILYRSLYATLNGAFQLTSAG